MKLDGYAIVDAMEEWIKAREAHVRSPKAITPEAREARLATAARVDNARDVLAGLLSIEEEGKE